MWAIIGILFLAVLYVTFKTGNANAVSGNVVATKSVASSSGMVGGC